MDTTTKTELLITTCRTAKRATAEQLVETTGPDDAGRPIPHLHPDEGRQAHHRRVLEPSPLQGQEDHREAGTGQEGGDEVTASVRPIVSPTGTTEWFWTLTHDGHLLASGIETSEDEASAADSAH
jgi:hypothetical protein